MNQRIVYAIAKEVAVDLLGHREMHVRRASLPVVAPSRRVPVCLDGNMRGTNRESTLLIYPLSLSENTAASAFVVVLPLHLHVFLAVCHFMAGF